MTSCWGKKTEPFKKLANNAKSSPEAKAFCSSVSFIMSITYIAFGAVYLHDCPIQEMIPIYLIVAGVFCIILSFSMFPVCTEDSGKCLKVWTILVSFIVFCWFIAGNYWIYSVYKPSYNKHGTDVSRYCNKTLYVFSFWTTTLFYILLGFLLVFYCCMCFCLSCSSAFESDNTGENPPRVSAQKDKESNSVV